MRLHYTPYILPLIAAATISGWVALYSWSRRSTRSATVLGLLALALTEWSLTYALEIAGADLPTKILWGKAQYVGIVAAPLLCFIFAYTHANQGKIFSPRVLLGLSILPLITWLLAVTTEWHHLVWQETYIQDTGLFTLLGVSHGPWFWVYLGYSYLLLAVSTLLILRSIGRRQGLYQGQTVMLVLAALFPWIGNALYLLDASPLPRLDLTPFAFTFTVVALAWGIFGFRLINLSPIARDIVIEGMNDGMFVVDAQGLIADINPAAQRLLGQGAAAIIGRPIAGVFSSWPQLVERYRQAPEAFDEISMGKGSGLRWYELRLSPLYDRRQQFIGQVITVRDITERKHIEALLQDNEARYRQIVENAGDLIYRTDLAGRFTYVNLPSLRLMGFSESDLLGKSCFDLVLGEWRSRLKQLYLRQFARQDLNTYFEFPACTADGREIWLGQNVQIIKEGAQVVGFQAVARDITVRRQAEQAMAFARDQALEASQLKSRLLARVSHELRTPLSSILGYAELLQYNVFGPLDERQKQPVQQIIDSTHYLGKVINELIDAAQIEASAVELHTEPVSPRALVDRIEASMSMLAAAKGVSLVTHIAPDVPDPLWGDARYLEQILDHLTSNAIKYTSQGEVRLKLYSPDPAHWVMQVSDTGAGIPPEAQTLIFEPFCQANDSITRENRGAGLGLSIVKQLVDLMQGQITLASQVGQGSTFTVFLPLSDPLKGAV